MLDWLNEEIGDTQKLHIGGKWVVASNGATFATTDPTTGKDLALVADATQEDVNAAIAAAHKAQPGWAALPPAARAAMIQKASALFVERQESFVQALITETGSGFGKAHFECSLVPLAMAEAAALTTRAIGETYPSQIPGKINRTMRTPAGVIGSVSPWNFSVYLSLRGFIYALALGNTAVLKPSEDSPLSGGVLLAQLFHDAGFPPGVFNVVTTSRDGAAKVGDAFVNDPRVNVLSFTGSTGVGQRLATACASVSKHIMLEMGGKNPVIVLDDADVDHAVDLAFFSAFLHQGQICMSADKLIVHRSIYDEFVEKLVVKAKMFVPTDPNEQHCVNGPIINIRQLRRIEALIDSAVQAGAMAHCGGKAQDPYYETTVLTGVTRDMAIWQDEIFGPVTMVFPFDSEEEALDLANDTPYGLSASIVTGDLIRGETLAERVQAGMVHVNDSSIHDEPHCPFAGLGASGGAGKWGAEGAIEAFTEQRWITSQRVKRELPF